MSYRTAVVGMALGLVAMSLWLWCSGIPLWAVFVYLFGAFVIFLALTRVIVEAGLAAAVQGMSGTGFLISSVGSTSIGVAGVLGAGITLAWAGDLLVFMMAPCANGIRMLHGLGRHKKRILAMIGMAMAIGNPLVAISRTGPLSPMRPPKIHSEITGIIVNARTVVVVPAMLAMKRRTSR